MLEEAGIYFIVLPDHIPCTHIPLCIWLRAVLTRVSDDDAAKVRWLAVVALPLATSRNVEERVAMVMVKIDADK